jgi:two-component system chemotaxis response regulator CheB
VAPRKIGIDLSVNTIFRSAARAYGPNAIGVILSGSLDDGTVGLWEIKSAGGIAIVQSPMDAIFDSTPRNAIENVKSSQI